MSNENNNTTDGSNSSAMPQPPATSGGYKYPWGYHLPCYTTVDSTSAHTCNKTKRYGNFLVNEDASHYEN